MKNLVLALSVMLVLVACREKDPGDAPPVGRSLALAAIPAPAEPAHAGDPTATREQAPHQRAGSYRRAQAQARSRLDTAWNACSAEPDDDPARCRDDALVAYDAELAAARAAWGDDIDEDMAATPGVVERPDDVAVVQVTGIRG